MRALEIHEEDGNKMFDLRQKFMAVLIGGLMLAGGGNVFAQKNGDKRPPKDENKVVVQPKGERPPPRDNNNQGNKRDGKKKP
jgi:hypothetical protein